MQEPEFTADETLRLMTLKSLDILDTPKEDRFDRLTRLAKRMFKVPIAMVTLIDEDRQWMKSCAGIEPQELPRNISFCGHAILGDDVFVIPNMLLDDRFSDNPLVLEQDVRFYAGAPIKATNGCKLGTLCLVDTEPREFCKEDRQSLADLAAMVELEIAALELATHDVLTGLLNRRGFQLLAMNAFNFTSRNNLPSCVCFFDLNGFKEINDQHGHDAGDEALIEFANLLKNTSRDSDVIARQSGDEFVMLFMDTSFDQANVVISKINDKLDALNKQATLNFTMTFAHGLVEFNLAKHSSLKDLIEAADELMYHNKP